MIERYARPQMLELWSLENKFRAWLEVEMAVCEAWTEMGVIPEDAMQEIRDKADFELERILEIEEKTRHDVIAFLTAVEEKVGPAARWIHLGCTSSDIVDTANGLLLTRAGNIVAQGFERVLAALADLAERHRSTLVMGRTHGIHAEPTSFGLKMAGFHAEMQRHYERFKIALEGVRVGKISGAVGTYAHLEPKLETLTCNRLGLKVDPISTQIIQRDRHAAFMTALALTAGGVERLCVELRHLQRTEVLEVEEGFAKGQKGSSAMPHKKNPISAENLTGLSRVVRSNCLASMENMALWHERDISHSSVERVIFPDSTELMDYILNRLAGVLEKLRILPENMQRNIDLSHGLYLSQRVLLALVENGMARQEAYEMVQRRAMQSWDEKQSFPELVRADKDITSKLPEGKLDELLDPSYYMRFEDLIFTRVFGHGPTGADGAAEIAERKASLARLLVKLSYKEGDFTLASGKRSDYYFDCRQTALNPQGGRLIGQLFLHMLENRDVDGVAGMTMGADPLVASVSVLSTETKKPLPAIIVRKEAKGYGTKQYCEGLANFAPGSQVALLEDVVTTGGTLVKVIDRIEAAGLKVACVLCVLDREEGGTESLAARGYKLESIFTRSSLLAAAGKGA